MIKYVQGDIFLSDAEAIVNTVNTVGVMGKGLALQFKKKFPENYKAYVKACQEGKVSLGKMFIYPHQNLLGNLRYIINFPTKGHWKGNSNIDDIRSGLESLRNDLKHLGIKSIAIPPLGCGLGGLSWRDVRGLIEETFKDIQDIDIFVYAPSTSK